MSTAAGDRHEARATLRVEVEFHLVDPGRAEDVAARMVESAQQIANLPECECDVDVSVELERATGDAS